MTNIEFSLMFVWVFFAKNLNLKDPKMPEIKHADVALPINSLTDNCGINRINFNVPYQVHPPWNHFYL